MRYLLILIIAVSMPIMAQQYKPVSQLTSNNIYSLAGNGDTLWLATGRGVNYRTDVNRQTEWPGFEMTDAVADIVYSTGRIGVAVAFVYRDAPHEPMGFRFWDHGVFFDSTNFRFAPPLHESDSAYLAGRMIFNGYCLAPFNWGGLVWYEPAYPPSKVVTIMPGDSTFHSLGWPTVFDPVDRDSSKVLSLADLGNDSVLVATPRRLFTLKMDVVANRRINIWDTLYMGADVALAGEEFVSFNSATALSKDGADAIYSVMTVKRGANTQTGLYRLSSEDSKWRKMLNDSFDSRRIVSTYPIPGGGLYVFFSDGKDRVKVSLFADTSTAGAGADAALLREIMTHDSLRVKLAAAAERGSSDPNIQDILFLPSAADPLSGTLAIATSTGLYLCASANPLAGVYGEWKFVNYVRSVKKNEAYALPGIMRASDNGRFDKSVFVYGLKKKGKVTIKVYDYNMSLVKTVVKGKERPAGGGGNRSTKPDEDVWDGTNRGGKRVSPGVYYFKITSTGGERLFGKVIVAK